MKKFSIKKQFGIAVAAVSTVAVLLLAVGVGLLINQNNVEAAMCTGAGCSHFTVKKDLIENDGSDISADSEFKYNITVSADADIFSPVGITDMLGTNIRYQRVQSVDFGGLSPQSVSTNYTSGGSLELELPNGIQSGQEIVFTILAKAVQPSNYMTVTVSNPAYIYSAGDSQCTNLNAAQNYGYDNCVGSLSFNIVSIQLQIDKTIDGNYESYDDIHTGEEFFYTLTVTNNAIGTYARDTITVYDEISPYLSNVRIDKILYFNKLVEGFDDNNNLVDADPPYCTISSQTMKCAFNSLLYDETTTGNQIIIRVAATPSAQYVLQDTDAYTISNEAFVYSPSDSYCKTLDKAKEDVTNENKNHIMIPDGNGGERSRCKSKIEFSVIQPQLEITKAIKENRDGRVWCYYKDSTWDLAGSDRNDPYTDNPDTTIDESNYNNRKDITGDPDGVAECLNENEKYREPTEAEIQSAWIALSDTEKDIYGWKPGGDNNAVAYNSFKAYYKTQPENQILVSGGTAGGILDNSIHNGETLVYVLTVTNTGSGDTKGDIIITDQLDKNAFTDAGVSVQPLTGGVECSVQDLLVKCVVSRVLNNDPSVNPIIIQIAATVENAGTIYNTAYVGGGGDMKCPVGEDNRMWCKSNEVSTYVTAPELHINKELRIHDSSCPSNGESSDSSPTDDDACWSTGTVIVDGSWVKYVIKVTNEGTANTEGLIVIHDQIPEYLEVDRTTLSLKFDDDAYSYTAGLCEFRGSSNRDLYCRAYDTMEGGLMAKNGTWTIEFNARVTQGVDITKDNNRVVNYAYVYGGRDAVCSNETIELSVQEAFKSGTISPYDRCYDYLGSTIVSPKLKVSKTISSGQVQAGKAFKYTISVNNIGDHDMPFGTKMVDILPADITIDTTSLPSGCEYDEGSRRITCTINEKIVKNRPMLFDLTATTTNATGTITNKAIAYNQYDKDCSTELAATYTNRCHDIAVAQSMAPVLKVNMYTNVLYTYVGGQVEYRIVVKNVGNMPTTETTTINQTIPDGLRVLGIRAQKGVCWPNSTEIKCEIPADIKPGETVNISVLTQAAIEGDITSDVNLYDGGDTVCSVDESTDIATRTTSWLTTPVFAADTPVDLDDEIDEEDGNKPEGGESTTDTSDKGESTDGDTTLPETIAPQDTGPTVSSRNSRCQDSATIKSYNSANGVLGINDSGIGSPMAGALNLLQAMGTVSILGVASYGLLKFGFVATPIKT